LARKLRSVGVRHVVCWRSAVRDETAITFSKAFYTALDHQDPSLGMDYPKAFSQAVARTPCSSVASGHARKPAKHLAAAALDVICLLSEDGDRLGEPAVSQTTHSGSSSAQSATSPIAKLEVQTSLAVDHIEVDVADAQDSDEDEEDPNADVGDEHDLGDEVLDHEDPVRNWRPPSDSTDYSALAGKHEREVLSLLEFKMQLDGADIQVGNGINMKGFLSPDVMALWRVSSYEELWGDEGKVVAKAVKFVPRPAVLQKVIESLDNSLSQRNQDMVKHAQKRSCGGACPRRRRCRQCAMKKSHEYMESQIRACKEAIEGLIAAH